MRHAAVWIAAALVLLGAGMKSDLKKATFAAGCFWGVEKIFADLDGVVATSVGYTGGTKKNPTYEEVCLGRTGHAEAIEIVYDPARISYGELLVVFWQYHDPTTPNRQGNDVGTQYRSAIFYHDDAEKAEAERSMRTLDGAGIFDKPVVTEIAPAGEFWRAEEYHQKYLKKNPNGYCHVHLQSNKIAQVLKVN